MRSTSGALLFDRADVADLDTVARDAEGFGGESLLLAEYLGTAFRRRGFDVALGDAQPQVGARGQRVVRPVEASAPDRRRPKDSDTVRSGFECRSPQYFRRNGRHFSPRQDRFLRHAPCQAKEDACNNAADGDIGPGSAGRRDDQHAPLFGFAPEPGDRLARS